MAERLAKIKINFENKLRYYKNIEYPSIKVDVNDIYIISKIGDRLDLLANDFYGNSRYWWVISRSNPGKIKSDSFFIDPGLQIRIPNNVTDAYSVFDSINK
jgi:hypothetical protein|tara:strand:+ start:251 stop:553 length:303 start_codon:yes stop_codon:yes gene_type:complete